LFTIHTKEEGANQRLVKVSSAGWEQIRIILNDPSIVSTANLMKDKSRMTVVNKGPTIQTRYVDIIKADEPTLTSGKHSQVFGASSTKSSDKLCFSIITRNGCVGFEASDERQRDLWFEGFKLFFSLLQ